MTKENLPKKVLIIEDDPGLLELLKEKLSDMGYLCIQAGSGKSAFNVLAKEEPDLLLLDYSLPDMSAYEFVEECRKKEVNSPFIIITGRGDEGTAIEALHSGARDYVIKDSSFLDKLPLAVKRVFTELDTEKQLEEAANKLEKELAEKKALLKEIHHRVKNNLQIVSSLIKLQADNCRDDKIDSFLSDLQSRISAMAIVHETLYQSDNLSGINFLDYLRSLTENLLTLYFNPAFSIELEYLGNNIFLSIDKSIPLGLIANELITNCFKHAFVEPWQGRAKISICTGISENKMAFIEISDNGLGIKPEEAEIKTTNSLGMRLIEALTEQLGARLKLIEKNGVNLGSPYPGTKWRIELKATEAL